MRKMILILTMCAAFVCMLAGCGRSAEKTVSKVVSNAGSAISKAGEELEREESRMESSRKPSASSSRNLEVDGYGAGNVDSGTDGVIGDADPGLAPGINSAEASSLDRESSAGNPGQASVPQ